MQEIEIVSKQDAKFDDVIVPTGDVLAGTVQGIDFSKTKVRVIVAKVGGKPYSAYYDQKGKFRMTVPRGTKPDDFEDMEVRFVDGAVTVASKDPLVLDVKEKEGSDF